MLLPLRRYDGAIAVFFFFRHVDVFAALCRATISLIVSRLLPLPICLICRAARERCRLRLFAAAMMPARHTRLLPILLLFDHAAFSACCRFDARRYAAMLLILLSRLYAFSPCADALHALYAMRLLRLPIRCRWEAPCFCFISPHAAMPAAEICHYAAAAAVYYAAADLIAAATP